MSETINIQSRLTKNIISRINKGDTLSALYTYGDNKFGGFLEINSSLNADTQEPAYYKNYDIKNSSNISSEVAYENTGSNIKFNFEYDIKPVYTLNNKNYTRFEKGNSGETYILTSDPKDGNHTIEISLMRDGNGEPDGTPIIILDGNTIFEYNSENYNRALSIFTGNCITVNGYSKDILINGISYKVNGLDSDYYSSSLTNLIKNSVGSNENIIKTEIKDSSANISNNISLEKLITRAYEITANKIVGTYSIGGKDYVGAPQSAGVSTEYSLESPVYALNGKEYSSFEQAGSYEEYKFKGTVNSDNGLNIRKSVDSNGTSYEKQLTKYGVPKSGYENYVAVTSDAEKAALERLIKRTSDSEYIGGSYYGGLPTSTSTSVKYSFTSENGTEDTFSFVALDPSHPETTAYSNTYKDKSGNSHTLGVPQIEHDFSNLVDPTKHVINGKIISDNDDIISFIILSGNETLSNLTSSQIEARTIEYTYDQINGTNKKTYSDLASDINSLGLSITASYSNDQLILNNQNGARISIINNTDFASILFSVVAVNNSNVIVFKSRDFYIYPQSSSGAQQISFFALDNTKDEYAFTINSNNTYTYNNQTIANDLSTLINSSKIYLNDNLINSSAFNKSSFKETISDSDNTFTAIPKDILFVSKYLMDVDSDDLANITATYSNLYMYVCATTDGINFYTYDSTNTEWISIDISNINNIKTNGISNLSSVPKLQWQRFVQETNKLGFAVLLGTDTYDSTKTYTFTDLGITNSSGVSIATYTTAFNFICVGYSPNGYKKFVAERNIQKNISWDALSDGGVCTGDGIRAKIGKIKDCRIRLISTLPEENVSTDDLYEWDSLISTSNRNWNAAQEYSWTSATPIGSMGNRIVRNNTASNSGVYGQTSYASTTISNTIGFRPVLEIPYDARTESGASVPTMSCTIKNKPTFSRPGEAVPCCYTVNEVGTVGEFSMLGIGGKPGIPEMPGTTPDGTFYFINVGYTPDGSMKFVADRNIQAGISWDTLSEAGYCTLSGKDAEDITGIKGSYIRLMHSAVTNPQMDREASEWDAIIFNNKIGASNVSSASVNDWSYNKIKSWMLDTPSQIDTGNNEPNMANRVLRGMEASDYSSIQASSKVSTLTANTVGFRPVLVIPTNRQSVLVDTVITPSHTLNSDVHVEVDYSFLSMNSDFSNTTYQYYINYEPFFEEYQSLDSFHFEYTFPLETFNYGENHFQVRILSGGVQNRLNYKITREKAGDISRVREHFDWSGGFDSVSIAAGQKKSVNASTTIKLSNITKYELPTNLAGLSLED